MKPARTSLARGVVPPPMGTYTPVAFGTQRREPAPDTGIINAGGVAVQVTVTAAGEVVDAINAEPQS